MLTCNPNTSTAAAIARLRLDALPQDLCISSRTGMTVAGKSGQAWALEVLIPAMKHVTERLFADPVVAARQLVQLASGIKAVQDGRIHIEKINYPFLYTRITMRWFRSELVRDTAPETIAHLFICPNCKRAQRSDTKFTPMRGPPDKLASPRFRVLTGGR